MPEPKLEPHPWRTYLRRLALTAALAAGSVPALWAAGRLGGEVAFGVVAVAWMGVWGFAIVRFGTAPCPRCGGRMPFFPRSPSRACPTCGFPFREKSSGGHPRGEAAAGEGP